MSASEPASRSRKILQQVVKIGLGLLIVGFVASQLRLEDRIVLRDRPEEPIRGRYLEREGDLVARTASDEVRRWSLSASPILEKHVDGRLRVRAVEGEPPIPVEEAWFEGTVSLEREGARQSWSLREVALTAGVREQEWEERVPDLDEGLFTIYGRLGLGRYALILALMGGMYAAGVARWLILLRRQGLTVGVWEGTRLTFIGFFFNNVVPGLTGGDVIKAVMIARRHKGQGAEAVTTVVVDRVLGLFVLALLSATVLALFPRPEYRLASYAIFALVGVAVLSVVLFFSRRVRKRLALDRLLTRLPMAPMLKRLDRAVFTYRQHPLSMVWCVLLSVASHVLNILSIYLMGMELGVDSSNGLQGEPFVTYFATVPVILIASSVPLLPGGWGVGELMYGWFFRTVGVRNLSLSLGLSILTRASMLLWSLLGGVFLLFDRKAARAAIEDSSHPETLEAEDEAARGAPEPGAAGSSPSPPS